MRRKMEQVWMLGILAGLFGSFICCGGGGGGSSSSSGTGGGTGTTGPNDLPGGTTALVQTNTGGTITTANGISLEIPPGALSSNTEVKVIPLKVADDNIGNLFVNGARFEPEGAVLGIPAVVRMPLPADWDGAHSPEIHEGKGNDPLKAIPTGRFAKVIGQPGAYVAEVGVSHFSTVILGRNCHKAAIRRVLSNLQGKGLSSFSIIDTLGQCYPAVNLNDIIRTVDTQTRFDGAGPKEVQAVLDTYFADLGGWEGISPPFAYHAVPPDLLEKIRNMARKGRMVAFAFKSGPWGKRSGQELFFNPIPQEYPHTALLEVQPSGEVKIFNGLPTTNTGLMRYMREVRQTDAVEFRYSGEGDGLNQFRMEEFFVPLEKDICGAKDCLNDPNNGLGFQIEVPPPRTYPWNSVRVYAQLDNLSGHDYADAQIRLDNGNAYSFMSKSCEKGGIALISENEFPGFYSKSLSSREIFEIYLSRFLSASKQYSRIGSVNSGDPAEIWFQTEDIKDEDDNSPVSFFATAGTIFLELYGFELGDRIRGTFDVSLQGDKLKCLNSSCDQYDLIPIKGTAQGKFDFSIRWHSRDF